MPETVLRNTKICSRCKKPLHVNSFNKNRTRLDGRAGQCKVCSREAAKTWNENNRAYVRQYNQKYRERNAEKCRQLKKNWNENNGAHVRQYGKARYKNNLAFREKKLVSSKEYYQKYKAKRRQYQKGLYKKKKDSLDRIHRRYLEKNPLMKARFQMIKRTNLKTSDLPDEMVMAYIEKNKARQFLIERRKNHD